MRQKNFEELEDNVMFYLHEVTKRKMQLFNVTYWSRKSQKKYNTFVLYPRPLGNDFAITEAIATAGKNPMILNAGEAMEIKFDEYVEFYKKAIITRIF